MVENWSRDHSFIVYLSSEKCLEEREGEFKILGNFL